MNLWLSFSTQMSTLGWSGRLLSSARFALSEFLMLSALLAGFGGVAILIAMRYGDSLRMWLNSGRRGLRNFATISRSRLTHVYRKILTGNLTRETNEQRQAREAYNDLNRHIKRGWARYLPIWFCLIVGMALTYFVTRTRHIPIEYGVAVTDVIGPYRFTFQHVDRSNHLVGHEFTEDICRDYDSPGEDFRQGTILDELIHTDEKKADGTQCWSLNPDKHCGWFKRRDSRKNPVYVTEVSNGN